MDGRLYIDDIDVYSRYGVYVVEGGWNGLVGWAPLKAPETYIYPECDGVEADLTAPVLDTRSCSIKVAFIAGVAKLKALLRLLSDGAYHMFRCESIRREYRLRLVSMDNLDLYSILGFVELKFVDDFPLLGYNYIPPVFDRLEWRGLTIDSRSILAYNASVLEGIAKNFCTVPNVRTNLLINTKAISGCMYDSGIVVYDTKELKIPLLFRAESLPALWTAYDALLYDMVRPGERKLRIDIPGVQAIVRAYYKSMTVKAFYPNGKIWLEAEITMSVTNARIATILAAEDGRKILTDNNDMILIFD